MTAVGCNAFMQRAVELVGRPVADAGFFVRRDVRGIDRAELGLKG